MNFFDVPNNNSIFFRSKFDHLGGRYSNGPKQKCRQMIGIQSISHIRVSNPQLFVDVWKTIIAQENDFLTVWHLQQSYRLHVWRYYWFHNARTREPCGLTIWQICRSHGINQKVHVRPNYSWAEITPARSNFFLGLGKNVNFTLLFDQSILIPS